MPVNIHGKDYLTVAERIASFRRDHNDWGVKTEIVSNTVNGLPMPLQCKS